MKIKMINDIENVSVLEYFSLSVGGMFIDLDRLIDKVYHWSQDECDILNLVTFSNCDCEYVPPYGKVISANCKLHD